MGISSPAASSLPPASLLRIEVTSGAVDVTLRPPSFRHTSGIRLALHPSDERTARGWYGTAKVMTRAPPETGAHCTPVRKAVSRAFLPVLGAFSKKQRVNTLDGVRKPSGERKTAPGGRLLM